MAEHEKTFLVKVKILSNASTFIEEEAILGMEVAANAGSMLESGQAAMLTKYYRYHLLSHEVAQPELSLPDLVCELKSRLGQHRVRLTTVNSIWLSSENVIKADTLKLILATNPMHIQTHLDGTMSIIYRANSYPECMPSGCGRQDINCKDCKKESGHGK